MHRNSATPLFHVAGSQGPVLTRKFLATVLGASICIGLLSGCAPGVSTTGQTLNASEGSAKDDPKPTAEGPAVPPGGPAFVDGAQGAPVVKRDDEKPIGAKSDAGAGSFESAPAKYSDGVQVSVGGMRRGVVTATGPGSISGAPYIYMDLKIQNGSDRELAVSNVVVTLRYGKDKTAAAPLYQDAEELDFAGSIKAGDGQTRGYAFMIPKEADAGTLFVDIDGAHKPAVLSGKLPQ